MSNRIFVVFVSLVVAAAATTGWRGAPFVRKKDFRGSCGLSSSQGRPDGFGFIPPRRRCVLASAFPCYDTVPGVCGRNLRPVRDPASHR
jgi:hypothetical protein